MHEIAPRNSSFLHFHCLGTLPICNWINGSEASFTSRYEHQIPLFSSSSLVKNEGACAWYRKNTKLVYVYWVRYILPTYLKTIQNVLSICIKILYVNTIHFRISIGIRQWIWLWYQNCIPIEIIIAAMSDMRPIFEPMIKVSYQKYYHITAVVWHTCFAKWYNVKIIYHTS